MGWFLAKICRLASLAGVLSCVSAAVPAAPAPAAYAPCVACHGQRAEGNPALQAPAIAGQDAGYLKRQLLHFRSGVCGKHPKDASGAQMRSIALGLANDATIDALSACVAALPRTTVQAPTRGDLRKGTTLYHGKCGACHGGRAEGNPALNAPRSSSTTRGAGTRYRKACTCICTGTSPTRTSPTPRSIAWWTSSAR